MIRVSMLHEIQRISVKDKDGYDKKINLFEKNGTIYMGPAQSIFNRTYVLKDRSRLNFISKIDIAGNELLNLSVLMNLIKTNPRHSYFTEEGIMEILTNLGYDESYLKLKPKTYTCAKEMFIEYGFNTMNFCLDRRGDIWVHYKTYEEQKQYRHITSFISNNDFDEFNHFYKKICRYVRYIDTDTINEPNVQCFALRSLNITKLYRWLSDKHLIHKVKYVADVYNETLREIEFYGVTIENSYYKVIATEDGLIIKNSNAYNAI